MYVWCDEGRGEVVRGVQARGSAEESIGPGDGIEDEADVGESEGRQGIACRRPRGEW